MSIYKRICQSCGITFDGGPRAWYCPNCRIERHRKQDRESKIRQKNGTNRKIGEKYPCDICGEYYILSGGAQRYCSECAKKHLKELDNLQSREWNTAHKEKIDEYKKAEKERCKKIADNLQYITANVDNLIILRKKKGLSQRRLSILSGSDPKNVCIIENRETFGYTRLETLEKIAAALDMHPIDFFKELYK